MIKNKKKHLLVQLFVSTLFWIIFSKALHSYRVLLIKNYKYLFGVITSGFRREWSHFWLLYTSIVY